MKITRRSLLGGIAVAGVSAGAGAGTFAYLQDSEGTDMTINVGTLSLNSTDSFEFKEDGSIQGEDTFETTITIRNEGTLPVRQIILKSIELDDYPELAQWLKLEDITYGRDDPTSIKSDLKSNENNNGIFDLDDLKQNLESSDVRLEELIDDSEDGNGEVLYVDEEAYLTITAKWDYEQIPGTNSTEGETPDYNGATLTGYITIDGRQGEA